MNRLLLCAFICVTTATPALAQFQVRNGLPPTSMDSFVNQAGGQAELIYGDESDNGPPPYEIFDPTHRINAGIFGIDNQGLTTGHGSNMPSAWGADEFIAPPGEFSQSGPSNDTPGSLGVPTATPGVDTGSGGTAQQNQLGQSQFPTGSQAAAGSTTSGVIYNSNTSYQ